MYTARGGVRHEVARRFHDLFCHQEWNIGVVEKPIETFLEPGARFAVRWFPPIGKGKYLADPFGVLMEGHAYVVCEEFDYNSQKGVISAITLLEDGQPGRSQVVLDMPFHMSFPCVFELDDQIYCVPETYQAREISLYRADRFPDRWSKLRTLVGNFRGVDPTIFYHDGRWWLVCTNEDLGPNESLFVWYAEDPRGPWRPHAANPVKLGKYGTRPAGTPFVSKGQLYRPAMDCSRTYGRQIILNLVRTLTPTEFEEEAAAVVGPFRKGRYRDGVHTISAFGNRTVVDGLRIRFERTEFKRALERERGEFLGAFTSLWHKA